MSDTPTRDSISELRRARSERLRARYNLPDTSTPEFAAEAHRQSLALANSPHAEEDQAFVDSINEMFSDEESPE